MISGHTLVYGLVGHPVRHSLSPQMHTTLFTELGLDAVYVAFDVDPKDAAKVADAVRTLDVRGVNLTIPFKEGVLDHLDRVTVAGDEAGAVNCIVNLEGFLTGYNTDGEGLIMALEEEHGFSPRGKRIVVLGAGGAGRAIAASMGAARAREVTLLNRTVSRAEEAAARIQRRQLHTAYRGGPLDPDGFDAVVDRADLVVNCLGGGAEATVRAFPFERLKETAIWNDINYWMPNPPGVAECAALGIRVSDGLGMLLHQGALSFELFTGHPVEVSRLRTLFRERNRG